MPISSEKPVPYATGSSIVDLVQRYRDKGLPKPVNGDVLGRAGVSESLIPRTLQALQTLDLIDEEGNPTEIMEGIRKAHESEYKSRFSEWIRAAYAEVFQFVNPEDSEVAIRDAFRNYNPVGQQDRMVSLFIALCEAAGMRTPSKTASNDGTPRARTFIKKSESVKKALTTINKKTQVLPSAGQGDSLPPAIGGLLKSLPPEGGKWTKEKRDKFYAAFGTMLDFCYEIGETEKEDAGDEDNA